MAASIECRPGIDASCHSRPAQWWRNVDAGVSRFAITGGDNISPIGLPSRILTYSSPERSMKYRKLGHTDLEVSLIGLGTMTWGEQNTEADAHEQLDYALSQGVNLVDAAEMYPVPPKAETQGRTEAYIGTWLAKTGRRNDIVLASKAAGPASDPTRPSHIRPGQMRLD